jgi:hypothetical protein
MIVLGNNLTTGIAGRGGSVFTSYEAAEAADRVTNTVTQTTHSTTHSFAVSDLAVGDVVEITGVFNIPSANSTDTLTVWGYLGGTVALGMNASDPINTGQALAWQAQLHVTAIGAGGSVHVVAGRGMTYYSTTGSPMVDFSIDMSSAWTLDFRSQWSVANASNIVDLRAVYVKILRGG